MEAPEHIFRAYDIRGIVGKDLFPDIISKCSTIFANIIKENGGERVAISGDVRLSTPSFIHAAISGVISAGVDVEYYYPLPIPVFNFSLWRRKNIHGGAYVTASHNPPEYNGIRFRHEDGTGFSVENREIRNRFYAGNISYAGWDSFGEVQAKPHEEVINEYVSFTLEKVPAPDKKLKVVIDGKFGASNLVTPKLFGSTHELILINGTIDGTFPSGMPDPLHGDVSLIENTVRATHSDIGIAYDGDGDRAAFFDEKGKRLPAEIIGLFLAEQLLKSGDVIVYNVMCSSILRRKAEEMGFKAVECKVGDVFVAETAKMVNAKLCVEESYHFFVPMYGFYYDDSIFTSILVTNLLANTNKKLSDIREMYGSIYVIRENVPVDDKTKFDIIKKFEEWVIQNYSDVSTLDGVKIYLENASFLARPSNTEPLIRLVAEGENKDIVMNTLKTFKQKILEIISSY